MRRPAFLVTVDTEGDDAWSRPREASTRNAAFVDRLQRLCEAVGWRPTWLVNHEMATCPVFTAFALRTQREDTAEIGMHLHAWDSPPAFALSPQDHRHQPFLVEYPPEIMDAKIGHMTRTLRERLGVVALSHRAGRWALDSTYARLLVRHGYRVDCSVTPHVSWRASRGAPDGRGGADYRGFPSHPYRMHLDRIAQEDAASPLLEVPVTIDRSPLHRAAPWAYGVPGLRRWAWRARPPVQWLYPDGTNLAGMQQAVRNALERGAPCVQLVLHSPDLMPGGSPIARDATAVEALYRDLLLLAREFSGRFDGLTLGEFAVRWAAWDGQAEGPARTSRPTREARGAAA